MRQSRALTLFVLVFPVPVAGGAPPDLDRGSERSPHGERAGSRTTSTPRKIWFVDELPKGPTGKILKREIEVPEKVAAS